MKFSIGYNHDIRFLDLLEDYRDNLEAVYFPIPNSYMGSGRNYFQNESYPREIPSIIKKCNSLHIKSQLLINATCGGESMLRKGFFSRILNYVKKLKVIGLKSIVVANPVYLKEFRRKIKSIDIETSVNCYLKSVDHALYLKYLGADVLTVDRSINRNISLIREIKKKSRLKIRILLNEGCLKNCPFRCLHYNLISHGVPKSQHTIKNVFPGRFGISIFQKYPVEVFRIPFIPPEELKKYSEVIDYFKLTTRSFKTRDIKQCLDAYINQKFSGNLLEILDGPCLRYYDYIDYDFMKKNNIFRMTNNCMLDCKSCNYYCERAVEKAVVRNSDYR
jgi:collagenase-like PrtC family protease